MSVVPAWRDLLPHLIPKRLRPLAPDARGKEGLSIWGLGEGAFLAGPVADDLSLRPDTLKHGLVEPSSVMTLDRYQDALAATQALWQNIEDVGDV